MVRDDGGGEEEEEEGGGHDGVWPMRRRWSEVGSDAQGGILNPITARLAEELRNCNFVRKMEIRLSHVDKTP